MKVRVCLLSDSPQSVYNGHVGLLYSSSLEERTGPLGQGSKMSQHCSESLTSRVRDTRGCQLQMARLSSWILADLEQNFEEHIQSFLVERLQETKNLLHIWHLLKANILGALKLLFFSGLLCYRQCTMQCVSNVHWVFMLM